MSECGREVEFAERLAKTEALAKSNEHRITDVEKQQEDLEKLITSVEVLATKEASVETDVKEIKADVKAISLKSSKRWDGIVDKALWLLIGAAFAALFAQGGIAL